MRKAGRGGCFWGELDNGIGADARKWLAFVISAIAEKKQTRYRNPCWEKSVAIPSKGSTYPRIQVRRGRCGRKWRLGGCRDFWGESALFPV